MPFHPAINKYTHLNGLHDLDENTLSKSLPSAQLVSDSMDASVSVKWSPRCNKNQTKKI